MQEVLTVKNLHTYYYSKQKIAPAVDGVDFSLSRGEILGIVGESGCGKSTVVRSVIGLIDKTYTQIPEGEILLNGKDLRRMNAREISAVRGKRISMIFQNPLSALNPVYTIGDQVMEILRTHEKLTRKEARARAMELLHVVKIPHPELRFHDYPHQLSGGMQQRVLIAIALACNPEIIIADEPTTALDVTIQAQILSLLLSIREEYGMGIILITHNMGVVAQMCEKMLVMYGGVVVEEGTCLDVFKSPLHPYTKGLLASIPSVAEDKETLFSIEGQVPVFTYPVTGCRFSGRCGHAFEKCQEEPPLRRASKTGQRVRCWLYDAVGEEA